MKPSKLYSLIESVTPPAIFSAVKKSRLYKPMHKVIKRVLTSNESSPTWHVIPHGRLKGRKFFVDGSGSWQKDMLDGAYDDYFFSCLDKIDLTGKTVYDIGAHIGFNALDFADRVGPSGTVIAFEPNTFNMERIEKILSENADLKKRIHLSPMAVSDSDGTEDFIFSDNIENGTSSGSFIESADTIFEKSTYEAKAGFKRVPVKIRSIDSLVSSQTYPAPFLIKLDIEGAENLAMAGAKDTIEKYKPIFLIEIHSILNMLKVGDILRDAGYYIDLLNEEPDGRCFIIARA